MDTDITDETDETSDDSTGELGDKESSDSKSESSDMDETKGVQAKVPEEFQKKAIALVQSCVTLPCLDFLQSEISDARHKLMSSQKKAGLETNSFSEEGMPE